MTCQFVWRGTRCKQPALSDLCPFHSRWEHRLADGERVDEYFHQKVLNGISQPVDSYLRESEVDALFHGRMHGDGRPLDAYTVDDEVEWDGV